MRPVVSEGGRLRAVALSHPVQRIYGDIRGGRFVTVTPGQLSVHLAMFAGQPALAVELIGARADGMVGPDGLAELRIGGGIPTTQAQRDLVPALFRLVTERIASAPGDRFAAALFQRLDTDRNLTEVHRDPDAASGRYRTQTTHTGATITASSVAVTIDIGELLR